MKLRFAKMHGLGNDFVVLNGVEQALDLDAGQIRFLANRHLGIGCDQLLLLENSPRNDCQFRYRIFNADGAEVEACGNGARCAGRFLAQAGLIASTDVKLDTAGGVLALELLSTGEVRVDMGMPRFEAAEIPVSVAIENHQIELAVNGESHSLYVLSMGNPHAVLIVEALTDDCVAQIGSYTAANPVFPQSVNTGFCQVLDKDEIRLRVFERGVGETRACGTGACAAVVACNLAGLTDNSVMVQLPGGPLSVEWGGIGASVFMTGDANMVYQGEIDL